jgi:hypothetical protein
MSVDAAQQRLSALLRQAAGLSQQRQGLLEEAAAIARQYGLPYRNREAARAETRRRGRSEEAEYGHE